MATVSFVGCDLAYGPDQTAYSFAYISPIDGAAVTMNTADTNTVIFNELRRASNELYAVNEMEPIGFVRFEVK